MEVILDACCVFDGIFSHFITALISLLVGGVIGYNISVKKIKQSQRAGNNSNQTQIGAIERNGDK